MFTGLYPTSHGMIPPTYREGQARRRSVRLSPEFDTPAEVLKRGGYRTAAVVTNPWTTPDFGFPQGFDAGDFVVLMRSPADIVAKSAAAGDPGAREQHRYLSDDHRCGAPRRSRRYTGSLAR